MTIMLNILQLLKYCTEWQFKSYGNETCQIVCVFESMRVYLDLNVTLILNCLLHNFKIIITKFDMYKPLQTCTPK